MDWDRPSSFARFRLIFRPSNEKPHSVCAQHAAAQGLPKSLRTADYDGKTWIHLDLRLFKRIPNSLDTREERKDTSFYGCLAAARLET